MNWKLTVIPAIVAAAVIGMAFAQHPRDAAASPAGSVLCEEARPDPHPQAMCGPECLARVCGHHGIKTTPKEIARLAGTTAEGTTMLGLAQAAETKGLQAKGMLLGWQELREIPKPSILWTPARHYLVLEAVEGEYATLFDPNTGRLRLGRQGLEQMWQGHTLVLSRLDKPAGAERTAGRGESMMVPRIPGLAPWVAALVLATTGVARADDTKIIPDVPRYKFFVSSHSTAAAEVLAYHGVKTELPEVVLIGGLEGRIYRCECGKDVHLWDVAAGTRLWAGAQGLKVNTEAKVLRGGKEGEALDFAQYLGAIDSGRPVVLTYSLDEASAKDMDASFRSQERVSVVGIGYVEGNPSRCVVASLPEDADKEKRFARLASLPGVQPGEQAGTLLIPWELTSANLIATFVLVLRSE